MTLRCISTVYIAHLFTVHILKFKAALVTFKTVSGIYVRFSNEDFVHTTHLMNNTFTCFSLQNRRAT